MAPDVEQPSAHPVVKMHQDSPPIVVPTATAEVASPLMSENQNQNQKPVEQGAIVPEATMDRTAKPAVDSAPHGPRVTVIPPPLPDESQPLDLPPERVDRPKRLPAVEFGVPTGRARFEPGHGVRLAPPMDVGYNLAEASDRSVNAVPPALDDSTLASLDRSVAAITQRADDLAARGAYFAARAEMIKALRVITQALDANEGVREHSDALGRAMRAFYEANDFAPRGSRLESELDLEQTVSGHRTPVLKNENVDHLAPIAAQQRYLEYSRQQLAFACGHVPAASQTLYVLARIYTALDNTQLETPMLCLPQAVVLHQAALAVDPRNGRAANELGVLLARFGQWEDARQVLLHSIAVFPASETWHNLSVVHQRLGQLDLARRASDQSAVVAVGRSEQSQGVPVQSVHWVDPKTFSTVRSAPEP
jgi:tetratricopeptide (TPR) repeat protein